MNSVSLVGRIARQPDLRYIPVTGTPVATFQIAINRDFVRKDGTREADFINIEVIGKSAEVCANYLEKGRLISLQGSIRVNNYEKDGERRTYTKVVTKRIQFLDYKKHVEEQKQPNYTAIENDPDIPF
ncbi:TPA: single-stranded DNA-binding protein [Clostridioides difficile]|uniref:single-stranded DNA-binding protein n=1 Tax=unclassified Clostridioides TaxID=2635829 RepID=UPI001D10F2CB|nr:single-stranded DNA-binding protein [Clostridioides sp. ES-S-0049-03]MCC0677316.1 single-stranded DNA-binding protein [Clostridioides sp. ES-W-0018-02]MCC0712465.1 single-stranded DNA-binding protein [Clostridioides sp. ES-W-0017-02]